MRKLKSFPNSEKGPRGMEENQQNGFSDLGFQRGKWGGDGNWFPETTETKRVNEWIFRGGEFSKTKKPTK